MPLIHPLLGRVSDVATPLRTGGATGRIGEYGWTRRNAAGKAKKHNGIDLLAHIGWPVYAAHAGRVLRAGWESEADHNKGYGLRCYVETPTQKTIYAHLDALEEQSGAEVEAGQLIGFTGNTGNSWDLDPRDHHLHFGVSRLAGEQTLRWGWVDPLKLLGAG